jgi:pimeloyl-ACP methyl ester carboxylesterase
MDIKSYSIPVKTFDNKSFTINTNRFPNEGKQAYILYPGFFQDADFWSIDPKDSFAKYLQKKGLDIWLIDPRGTGDSGGSNYHTTLDDFAASDLTAIIDFISNEIKAKPILIGHSQGGITSLMHLMGSVKNGNGEVSISKEIASERQKKLRGLVTLGSYPNMTYPKDREPAPMQIIANEGVQISIFGKKITLIKTQTILNFISKRIHLPIPPPIKLRRKLIAHPILQILLFPVTIFCNIIAYNSSWDALYYRKTVSRKERKYLFYNTIDASFTGIIMQFYYAVKHGQMWSADQKVNYSENYHLIKLPISVVGMEFDMIENAEEMKKHMFSAIASEEKVFTLWKDQGHENFVMNPEFFEEAYQSIIKVLNEKVEQN